MAGFDLANNSIRALLSGGTLIGFETYMTRRGEKLLSTSNLKKFGFQAVSSLAVNEIKSLLRPIIPSVVDGITDAYINPILIGGAYTVLARVVNGSKSYLYNFMFSMSAEMVAGFLEHPVRGLISPGLSKPMPKAAVAPIRTRVLG